MKALRAYITTRDKRVNAAGAVGSAVISSHFARLMAGETVRVGGRSSCGGRVDPTWVELTSWNEVVRKAKKLGLVISETPVAVGNAWATKSGGFWYENDYRLESVTGNPVTYTVSPAGVSETEVDFD